MRCPVEHSEHVFCDLQEIACFLRRQDTFLPDRFFSATRKTFDLIGTRPHLGKRWKVSQPEELRSRPVIGFPNYMVFYWVTDKKTVIWRVLHGSRDLSALFERLSAMRNSHKNGPNSSMAASVAGIFAGCIVSGCGGDFVDHPSTYSWVFRTNPPPEIQVTRSAFRQSSHFTYEYAVLLELTNSARWADEFRLTSGLVATNLAPDWERPSLAGSETPAWFMPKGATHYEAWIHTNEFKSRLLLARDPETGSVYFYDEQY